MSVDINYIGRFGNNLHQYVFARLLAVRNNLKIVTPWCRPDMIEFTPEPDGTVEGEVVKLNDGHQFPTDLTWLEQDFRNKHVVLKGYYQHPKFYDPHRDEILAMMKLPPKTPGHENDVACHLRLGDYDVTGGRPVIDPSWYADMLKREPGKKVFIVVAPEYSNGQFKSLPTKSWERQYIDKLKGLLSGRDVTVVSGTEYSDFHFLRSFGTIVSSNSTLSWWAAFLSDAKTIYTFERWRINSPMVRLAHSKRMTPTMGSFIWETGNFNP
jgi:hypothetical protein